MNARARIEIFISFTMAALRREAIRPSRFGGGQVGLDPLLVLATSKFGKDSA